MSDNEFTPGEVGYWHKRWEEKRTGWDHGDSHALIPEIFQMTRNYGLPKGARILEPGSGRGHQGAAIAQLGFEVTGYDISSIAVHEGSEIYRDVESFKLVKANCFEIYQNWRASFDGIFDRAVLCALPPDVRQKYLTVQTEYLKPKGYFLTIPFREILSEEGKEGPPFAIDLDELEDLFLKDFNLLGARDYIYSAEDSRIKKESIMIWQKK